MIDNQIDLKWNGSTLDIVLDEYGLEPISVTALDAVHQSLVIALRSSEYSQNLINCEYSDIPGLLIELEEELETNNPHIVIGSIDVRYDATVKELFFDCLVTDTTAVSIALHIQTRV